MTAVPKAPFQELLQWPQSFSVCCSIPLRSLYTTVSVSVLAFVCTTPQLALVGCLWLTLVESASITSQIPMKSCTESEGTVELTVPLWGPGCMCVWRGQFACPSAHLTTLLDHSSVSGLCIGGKVFSRLAGSWKPFWSHLDRESQDRWYSGMCSRSSLRNLWPVGRNKAEGPKKSKALEGVRSLRPRVRAASYPCECMY